ncbi:MAG TPA: iron-sulfur cluster assembly scaffold protein, partial [Bacilli bacterium]|nr:iron-sulfur cluster assembly scaffold protein [Bacilli bacterium]
MDNNIKRTIILDNYENPFNKGLVDDNTYSKINVNNESCIDNIDLQIKVEDNVIKDIRFDGEACAISTSATSIMIKLL